jgi:hypothetical protein
MPSDPREAISRRAVAGGPGDFMTVHELRVAGSQAAIGRALAAEAQRYFGWTPAPADPLRNRARRLWFERNWPQHHARMLGIAEALGLDPQRDDLNLADLDSASARFACSVA